MTISDSALEVTENDIISVLSAIQKTRRMMALRLLISDIATMGLSTGIFKTKQLLVQEFNFLI